MEMVRVEIDSIRVSLMSQDRVVVLKDVQTERYLPIWIGPFEAEAIRVELQDIRMTRPLTHDLLKSILSHLGGEVEYVIVSDLRKEVFYANLRVNVDGRTIDIDSRPSDAIALAVRLKVPIYIAESVMEKAAIRPDEEITTDVGPTKYKPADEDVEDTESEDLGVFKDFLDTLDLDDLDEDQA
jgi:bifunctional DNase/RNase